MAEGVSSRHFAFSKYTAEVPRLEKDLMDEVQKDNLIRYTRDNIIGDNECIHTNYGWRKLVYCDFAASGRSLKFIEDFIKEEILPFYGNTHTASSFTGRQTELYREEGRAFIKSCVNANISKGSDKDVLIYTGSGSTSAINKMVHVLKLDIPPVSSKAPVVFVGPFEHHSNLLPWREAYVEVIEIAEDEFGQINIVDLEEKLRQYSDRPVKIGSFSAASNVTGILADTNAVSSLLHKYNALSFWDYSSAAPYVHIDMNPVDIKYQNSYHK